MSRKKNPAVPATRTPVILKFDGKEYPISFGFNQLCEVETITGESFLTQIAKPTLTFMRAMLFVVLRRAGCELESLVAVGDKLHDLKEVDKMFRILLMAYKESQAPKKVDPPPAVN